MATVATHFQAYEVSNKGNYGNDSWYAEGIDMATGRQLWKNRPGCEKQRWRQFGRGEAAGPVGQVLVLPAQ